MENRILTKREREVLRKKLSNKKLTQQDSNYLSKYVRPKLREIKSINAENLLKRIEYNQKAKSIEEKIKKAVLKIIKSKDIRAIIIYGSAIQTSYRDYNDIDILIVTKKPMYLNLKEKYELIRKLSEETGLSLDIQIADEKSLKKQYPHNPSLIYQLKDSRVIYGKINLQKEAKLSKLDLRMKMDWSDADENSKGSEIYHAIRNAILVRLLLDRIVDNSVLNKILIEQIGLNLLENLRSNKASKTERKIASMYLKDISDSIEKNIANSKWENLNLSTH